MGVEAKPKFLKGFSANYPGAKVNDCVICHVNESNFMMNAYGASLMVNKMDFKAIEEEDSDGDGVSNIAEINAGSNPGDKSSVPSNE